jgi:glutathione S-transferase
MSGPGGLGSKTEAARRRFDQLSLIGSISKIRLPARGAPRMCFNRNRAERIAMGLHLVIGNKNYSSWSMRPWIAMKVKGIAFDETVIPIYHPGSKEKFLAHSPAGRVPILLDGDVRVWESLAILEYLAEKFPDAQLWPRDAAARAYARAIANEMHAGFLPLRRHLPMNMWRPVTKRHLTSEAAANVKRIDQMWSDCRARFGAGGAFLFGAFTAADAMYAPVVSRLHTYAVDVSPAARAYMDAVIALPAWQEWTAAALAEEWVLAEDEVDWPKVVRVS